MEENNTIKSGDIISFLQSLSSENMGVSIKSFDPIIINLPDINISQLNAVTKFASDQASLWEVEWMFSNEGALNFAAKEEMECWDKFWDGLKDELIKHVPKVQEQIIDAHNYNVLEHSIRKSLELRKDKPIEKISAKLLSKLSFFFKRIGLRRVATHLYTMALYPKGSVGRTIE
jgi:hypothetical protein